MTPLTPTLIISHLERCLPAPMPTPSVAPATLKMFHEKAENFAALQKIFTASQKNLTASRKCFTVCHYSCLFLGKRLLASPSALVSPLVLLQVLLSSQKQPLIFRQLSARCKRCHQLLFFQFVGVLITLLRYGWDGRHGWDVFRFHYHIGLLWTHHYNLFNLYLHICFLWISFSCSLIRPNHCAILGLAVCRRQWRMPRKS